VKRKYDTFFFGFLLSIVIVFFTIRPLNSPWFRIITADGLGYYSYLPAKFIYNDKNLEFKWFDKVYNNYYNYNSFATPTENFTSRYKDKTINKYYAAVSFLQMPFFFGTRAFVKLFKLHDDGFSQPYQMGIGFAGVFYACLGLWFLRLLLFKLFQKEWVALLVPIFIFYGTNVFTYTIYIGTFSHIYSFCFIILSLYFAYCFFNEEEKRIRNLLLFLLCSLIVILVRPFNILFLLAVPAFIKVPFKLKFNFRELKWQHYGIILLAIIVVSYQFSTLYIQTGSFFPYTYTGERFYFNKPPHVFEILFSYKAGLFIYVPLSLICFFSLLFIKNKKQFLFLVGALAVVILLYSYWWYWIILNRTIVDFTGILGILLAFFLVNLNQKAVRPVLVIVFLCLGYYQLKAFQLRNVILDEHYTSKEYFWRNFFTLHLINIFPVPPQTIIEEITDEKCLTGDNDFLHDGNKTTLISETNAFSKACRYRIPDMFKKEGFKKIKTSFWVYIEKDVETYQVVFKFHSVANKDLAYVPCYVNQDKIRKGEWEYKEFGCDLPNNVVAGDSLDIFLWSDKYKGRFYIDKMKNQFFLCNDSYEMKMEQ
jgi:hypothetical protein